MYIYRYILFGQFRAPVSRVQPSSAKFGKAHSTQLPPELATLFSAGQGAVSCPWS